MTIEADMVVLAAAMRPADGIEELAQKLNVGHDEFGFLLESHPKLRPVETNTAGVFICGACQAPKDIPEAVAQASAAASKVAVTFAASELTREPEIARINEQTCAACFACERTCPYHAIESAEIRARNGTLIKYTARVNQGLCMGCGTCVSVCPSKSADIEGFTEEEIYAMVEAWYERDERFRAEDRGLRVQLVHVPGRGPGGHGAPGVSAQRAHHPAAVHRPHRYNLVVKAFEIGADAVLVSGCHPGDCHYTAGNYHARRRWMLFRELLEVLGFDMRRLHFTWISAAEGKQFQQVVSEITEKTRELGPYRPTRAPCAGGDAGARQSRDRERRMLRRPRRRCAKPRKLLAEGTVKVVIGHGANGPVFITKPEDVGRRRGTIAAGESHGVPQGRKCARSARPP